MALSILNQMLVDAGEKGDCRRIKEALRLGADIQAGHNWALSLAAENGHTEAVALLLDYGADIHSGCEWALRQAAEFGHKDTVELLLDRGANLHAANDSALHWAAKNGYRDTVELLLDRGADLHTENNRALRWAAEHGHKERVAALLDRGADIHAENDDALRQAAFDGYKETVELLLERGADVHAENNMAIYWAAGHGHKETALLLLRQGADPKVKCRDGRDAFHRTELAEWMQQLQQAAAAHFTSGKPTREQCFSLDKKGRPELHEKLIDACVTGQFTQLVSGPLIESTSTDDRQLFQDIWEALPACWQDRHQNSYLQFIKEGGLHPILGRHTTGLQQGSTAHADTRGRQA